MYLWKGIESPQRVPFKNSLPKEHSPKAKHQRRDRKYVLGRDSGKKSKTYEFH